MSPSPCLCVDVGSKIKCARYVEWRSLREIEVGVCDGLSYDQVSLSSCQLDSKQHGPACPWRRKHGKGRASELMSPPSLPVYGSQVREKFPNEYKAREQDKLRYRYPRGESYMDVLSRCGHTRGSALAACQEPVD